MPADQPSIPKQFLRLFLLSSVPIHLWSILMLLRDYSWVLGQHSLDDFVGYAGYALLAAFFESLVVTGLLLLLGLLISDKWGPDKRLAIFMIALFSVSLWALAGQVFFILRESPPGWLAWFLLRLPYHRMEAMIVLWLLVIASIAVPVCYILRGKMLVRSLLTIADRLAVLASFYLVLDGFGFLLIVYRLVRGQG